MDTLTAFLENENFRKLVITAALLVGAGVARVLFGRFLRANQRMSTADRLRLGAHARNLTVVVLLLALVFVWASELREFAISLVAIAAALAIASKELIMCMSGSILRASTRGFEVGDRIEIKGVRGDVIDTGLLSTTILEIGPGQQRTGRSVVLPNSLFLAETVVNETFTDDFVLHLVAIPYRGEDWMGAEERLLGIAGDVVADYVEQAKASMDEAGARHGLAAFSVAPRVTLQCVDPETRLLLLRVPARAREKGRVEQAILRRWLGQEDASADAMITGF